jgi:S-adenosylmethionine:tRNA-ribosyltransferase-isomerase (queuine synthetase)
LEKGTTPIHLKANKIQRQTESYIVNFSWDTAISFAEILELAGNIPLPPYIKRAAEDADKESYQTIYAEQQGSVAAPTAGLHFTENVFESLQRKKLIAISSLYMWVLVLSNPLKRRRWKGMKCMQNGWRLILKVYSL